MPLNSHGEAWCDVGNLYSHLIISISYTKAVTIDEFLCKLSTKSMQFQYDFLDTVGQIYIYQAIYVIIYLSMLQLVSNSLNCWSCIILIATLYSKM